MTPTISRGAYVLALLLVLFGWFALAHASEVTGNLTSNGSVVSTSGSSGGGTLGGTVTSPSSSGGSSSGSGGSTGGGTTGSVLGASTVALDTTGSGAPPYGPALTGEGTGAVEGQASTTVLADNSVPQVVAVASAPATAMSPMWWWLLVLLAVIAVSGYLYYRNQQTRKPFRS